MTDWRKLRGRTVTVHASGTSYRGTVVEIGVHSLLLRATAGFREIPWERITRVVEEGTESSGPPSALWLDKH
jgi:hypothetical protein